MEHNRCEVALIFTSLSSNAYLFIYLVTEREKERGRGTCTQHASHFDLAYDREFFFFGGKGWRYKAGSGALPEMS